jgi:coenzyme Q-binding protein COQ10
MAQVVRDKVMAVSPKALFDTITDFENYPKFLSEVKGAKVKSKSGKKKKVVFDIEVIKPFTYTLEFEIEEPTKVSWKLIDSNFFKTNEGKWELKPKGPKSTEVHYELEVGFGFFVPGFITKKLTEVNLPKMFDSFEQAALSRKVGKE